MKVNTRVTAAVYYSMSGTHDGMWFGLQGAADQCLFDASVFHSEVMDLTQECFNGHFFLCFRRGVTSHDNDWRAIATDFIYRHDGAHQIHACGKSNTKMRAIRHCCKAMDAAVKKYNLE
jgi:hypothetical protein